MTDARALTIAGSDPCGGAGIFQDVRTFAACGVWGMGALTCVTVQNTIGVTARTDMTPQAVRAQIDAVVSDLGVDAVKTGLLPTTGIVATVAEALDAHRITRLVVDPVLVASTGDVLADDDVLGAIRTLLMTRATALTPNADEAFRLTGIEVTSLAGQRAAARALRMMGVMGAIVTGGHVQGDEVIDVVIDRAGVLSELRGPRVDTPDTHGTGCTFSAALCAHLALGRDLLAAAENAKAVVARALHASRRFGAGPGPVDPMGPPGE